MSGLSVTTNTPTQLSDIGDDWVFLGSQSPAPSDERVTSSLAQTVLTQPRSEPKPLTDRVISWIRNIPSKINNFFSALFSTKAPEIVKAPEVQLTEEQTRSLQFLNYYITEGISNIVSRCWIPGGVENLVRDNKLAECHKEDFLVKLRDKLGTKLREMHKACNEELKDFILHPKPINELSDDAKFLLTILWADCSRGYSDSHKNDLSSLMDVPEDMGKTMLHEQVEAKIKKFNLIQENATQEVLDDFYKKDKAQALAWKKSSASAQSIRTGRSFQRSTYKTYLGCGGDNCAE